MLSPSIISRGKPIFLLSFKLYFQRYNFFVLNMLKRYSKQSVSVDKQAKAHYKHQILLEDYLELQKDFVSMGKKLEKKKQDKEILLAEVRFLRRRHEYLTMLESQKSELGQESVQPQNSCLESIRLGDDANVATKKKVRNLGNKKGGGKKRKVDSLISRKKKSSEDPVALNVQ